MKLVHEAMRVAIPRAAAAAAAVDPATPESLGTFLALARPLLTTYKAHSVHEDDIMFPAVRAVFPGLDPGATAEHEHHSADLVRLEAAINAAEAAPRGSDAAAAAVRDFQAQLPPWGAHVLAHLRGEEAGITVVARKYLTLARQRELTRRMFDATRTEDWHVIVPFVLANLPHPGWQQRYVRAWLWAIPERAVELGLIIYRGCDSVTYAALADDAPELVPRGAAGWRKQW